MASFEQQTLIELSNSLDRNEELKKERERHGHGSPVNESNPKEVIKGFQVDGGGIESDVAMHRFSAELSQFSPSPLTERGRSYEDLKKDVNKVLLSANEPNKKETSKSDRRALQEAQRAAKQQRLIAEGKISAKKLQTVANATPVATNVTSSATFNPRHKNLLTAAPTPVAMQFDDQKKRSKLEKKQIVPRTISQKEVPLFSHLQQYEKDRSATAHIRGAIHPAVLQLGLKFAENKIMGGNARCISMLTAFKQAIEDYVTPPMQVMKRHLDSYLKPMIGYLVRFRPMGIGMGNAVRYLKLKIAELEPELSEKEAKAYLFDCIDTFINERIILADQMIATHGISKINNGDVILTYAKSSVAQKIIVDAFRQGREFRVVVVDARPLFEGKELLKALVDEGIECSYVLINAISYIMSEVSKVFLGAHGLFSNGTVISRSGTAMIALMARRANVPVMVCCETYKFSDRVQLDSFVFNELGDPDDLINIHRSKNVLDDWRDIPSLKLLNLLYDLTPAEDVSMVITEVGMIPCTSVPVILREYMT